ncbi:MAG: toll/interleukin-1 receptor domain-containing protein [Chloroflexota bacterium]
MAGLKQPTRAFLIYAHRDKKTVRDLYARLAGDGIEVWLDRERLLPGQDWQYEIRQAILKSDAVIVCLSPHFNRRKGYRHEELKIALEKVNWLPDNETFVIPVRLEECDMPESLRRLHRVDLFKAGGYKTLLKALAGG